MKQPQRVSPNLREVIVGGHDVALGFRHRPAAEADHALAEQLRERLAHLLRAEAGVGESPREETGVQQVQDRMGDPTDVLIDRHEVAGRSDVDGSCLIAGIAKAQEVPRRVHKGVHRVGLPECRAPTSGAGSLQEPLVETEWGLACRPELDIVGEKDRELLGGNRHDSVSGAVHHRDRAAPVSLPADKPVAQPVVDLA